MGFLIEISASATEPETVMELRLFKQFCLAVTAMTLFLIAPVDYLIHLTAGDMLTDLGFGVSSFFFYLAARRGHYYITSLFCLYLLNLNLSWFANDGSQGSVCLFFFNVFIYGMIFFRGRVRWLLLAVALANAMALIAAEPFFPQWLVPYHSPTARAVDLILSLTVSALSCSLMLWAVLSSYDREQQRLQSLNAELERNMAERIEAEQSLRQNRELLNAVIEGTSDAVFAKDTKGRYLLFNSAAARMTGKSTATALGNDDTFLFPSDEARAVMERDREIMASGEIRNLEYEMLTSYSGEKIVVQATKGPLRDENGCIAGVFGISRDVTKARRAEDEIRKLNAELDLRVTERTARLQAAIQEQESFSYSVSHDLRAPLRHINSYSAILEEECGECLSSQARGYLERIRTSSRNMGKLIDDLLELSRIGRSELQKTTVDLSELAQSILFRLQESEPRRGAEFVVTPGLTAHGDRILLQQALENLLGNAWKYTRPRELARIEVGMIEKAGEEVYFVRDNGVGFDMEYRDQLFGAFQRLHGAEFEGTGIGLATVKRIVKRHGGRVWAEGAVDQGATIYFTLRGGG
jgi:PAS domain S-box-containing protein